MPIPNIPNKPSFFSSKSFSSIANPVSQPSKSCYYTTTYASTIIFTNSSTKDACTEIAEAIRSHFVKVYKASLGDIIEEEANNCEQDETELLNVATSLVEEFSMKIW